MTILIRLADICNLKCRMCMVYTNKKKKPGKIEMSLEDYSAILKKLKSSRFRGEKITTVRLDGNREGLCYPHLDVAIKMAKEEGFLTDLVTNGVLLTSQITEKILKAGLDFICFSVTGTSKKTYSRFQGYSMPEQQFDKVCNNITNFISMKNALDSSCNTKVSILMDEALGENADEIRESLSFWYNKGLDSVVVRREYEPPVRKKVVGGSLCFNNPVINVDGSVFPCCGGSEDIIIGNILHNDNVFDSSVSKKMFQALAKGGEGLPEECASCFYNGASDQNIVQFTYQKADACFIAGGFVDFCKKAKNKKVFIFGNGEMAKSAVDECRNAGIYIDGIIDSSFMMWKSDLEGISFSTLSLGNAMADDQILLICTPDISAARCYANVWGFSHIYAYGYFFEQTYAKYEIFHHQFQMRQVLASSDGIKTYMGMGNIKDTDFARIDDLFERFIPSCREVWLFGNGAYGKAFYRYLLESDVAVNGFVVSSPASTETDTGNPIISIEQFRSRYESCADIGLILALDEKYYDDVLPKLLFLGDHLFLLSKLHKNLAVQRCSHVEDEDIAVITIHLTDHCNLSCYGCGVASPVAKEHFYDVDKCKNDILHLNKIVGTKLKKLSFSGGEALLHPQILDLAEFSREVLPVNCVIEIQTNGLILDKLDDDFWIRAGRIKLHLLWTLYPINYPNRKEVEAKANKYNVAIQIVLDNYDTMKKESWFLPLDSSGQQKKYNFLFCTFHRNCTTIKNGRLYACPAVRQSEVLAEHFGVCFPIDASDYLDVQKIASIQELYEFRRKCKEFCKFCAVRKRENRGQWRPSKKERAEWLLE